LIALGGQQAFAFQSSDLSREMLVAHNAVRARVGVAYLVWSPQLAERAQEWADALLASNRFAHQSNAKFGENLFKIRGAAATPKQVLNVWAAESRNYDYSSNGCRGVCGHYTQIVWRDTKAMGCAVARGERREIWVCKYDPRGNWIGRRPY